MPSVSSPDKPVFRDHQHVYQADRCRPLVRAAELGDVRLEALARGSYPGRPFPDSTLPELRSVGYWDAIRKQTWGLPVHRNEGVELTFMASGGIDATVEDTPLRLEHDHLLVTRPWQPHALGGPCVDTGKLVWLILDVGVRHPHQDWQWPSWILLTDADRQQLTTYLRHNEQYVWPGSDDVRRSFRRIAEAVEGDTNGSNISRLAVSVNELLLSLLDLFRSRQVRLRESLTSTERSVKLFLAELEDAIAFPWALDDMAENSGLGVTRFVHYCRKLTNMSPVKYLNHLRLQHAAERLTAEPERPVTRIAFDCGFSSSQYFANAFRKEFDCSPRDYRLRHCRFTKLG
ncbi:MAG: helix-turn-helix transcriptional regulator [Victivallales bacterium]|jgi:AraC-like DNA-binding protein|nr:helix-turn-helix transcriptional regulator [Victivallales bacterium]